MTTISVTAGTDVAHPTNRPVQVQFGQTANGLILTAGQNWRRGPFTAVLAERP